MKAAAFPERVIRQATDQAAAKAGLPRAIMTVTGVNRTLEAFMQVYGACLIGCKFFADRRNGIRHFAADIDRIRTDAYHCPLEV